MRAAWIILKKELVDNIRDRRSLGMALLFPALSPLIVGFAIFAGAKHEMRDATEPFQLSISGEENAIDLVAHLRAHGAIIEHITDDPELAVRKKKIDAVLVIDPGFAAALRVGAPARVTIFSDHARVESSKAARKTRAIIGGYSSTIAALRLAARGVSPTAIYAISIESRDTSTPESRGALLLLGLPLMLSIAAFIGGLYVAIDVTAGERERGSLEALAMNPIPRRSIGLGKLAAVFVFGAVSLVASGAGFALMPLVVPSELADIPIDPMAVVMMVVISFPLVLLASSFQVFVAAHAKGFKEAQSTLSYISLVPMVPGMILTAMAGTGPIAWVWVPIYGQQLLMGQWLRGETVGMIALQPTLTTLALALFFSWLALRRYDDERMYTA